MKRQLETAIKNKGEEGGEAIDKATSSPERKRSRTAVDEIEADPADVAAIVRALKAKPEWTRKVTDPVIANKWRQEAIAQGANSVSVDAAMHELLQSAVLFTSTNDGEGEENSVVTKLTFFEEGDDNYDEDDDDLRLDYDERDDVLQRVRNDVTWRDNIVPVELRDSLEAQLDQIAARPNKDFHPGSDNKVQDLIHPSLYPFIRGQSYVKPDSQLDPSLLVLPKVPVTKLWVAKEDGAGEGEEEEKEEEKEEEEEEKEEKEEGEDELDEYEDLGGDADEEREHVRKAKQFQKVESVYQWLPTEFDVAADGSVSIASYINNLDRNANPKLYEDIAAIFRLFVPLMETILKRRLVGRRLQVVVKAANYLVRKGEKHEGTWHVEGMPHERIVASGIYYYRTSEALQKSFLCFRELRQNSLQARSDTQGLSFNLNLGKADTPEGRCLTFANHLQHKVRGMEVGIPKRPQFNYRDHSDVRKEKTKKWEEELERVKEEGKKEEPSVRKILCFFLIDPDHRVVSSQDVPEQQWEQTRRAVSRGVIEAAVANKIHLPTELVQLIVEKAKTGFTWNEAKEHREKLMFERKYYVNANNQIWERNFSFCEH